MANSLLTGVSGLLAHQRMLDVTGNNLANVNTTGFKAQRVTFSDVFYETLRPAGPSNPLEIGSGSIVSQIRRNFRQSSLEATGDVFDMAMEGDGFFVVNDGSLDLITRAGSFGLDADQYLVDPSTGYRVQRFGAAGESNGPNPGFQTIGDTSIKIPLGSTVQGAVTENVQVMGNLSAHASGPAAGVLSSSAPFTTGGGTPATLGSLLNDFDDTVTPYEAGDSILIDGIDSDGKTVSAVLAVDDTSTMGDLIDQINSIFSGATATLSAAGNVQLSANEIGPSSMQLTFDDATTNVGNGSLDFHRMATTTNGTDGDTVQGAVEFFDALGRAHVLDLDFRRLPENHTWSVSVNMDNASGTLQQTDLGEIRFNDDGTFREIVGSASRAVDLTMQLNGMDSTQDVRIQLGGIDGLAGLTQSAVSSSVGAMADGSTSGTLYTVSVAPDGAVIGTATNGSQILIAQLAIATVSNKAGLSGVGESHFQTTINSGAMQLGSAASGGRGRVLSGQLEGSNVDLANEFTRLIVAQRGFSANARLITVADQVMEEVTNIIR